VLASSPTISADPNDILAHYALGDMPCFLGDEGTPVEWVAHPHRGVHLLKDVAVPRGQRRYVFSPRFEFRCDTAFDEVLRACATRRTGRSWILPAFVDGYSKLFEMGFAHSYEAWQDGELAGGCFGVHIGAYASVESMFYRVSHAGKAAYGRALLHLKQRGFLLVDSNPVADVSRNYGEEWIPQWQFERLLRHAIGVPVSLDDGRPAPRLPAKVRMILPVARVMRALRRKLVKRG
jgi:leucyl/phenylalanyl-tRNA--protein transferase